MATADPIEQLLVSKDIHEVTPLTRADYQTSCGTPLFELAREKGVAAASGPRYRAIFARHAMALALVRGELDEAA